MIYELRLRADIPTPQRAVAIRDALAQRLPDDIQVISWDATRATRTFTVTSVDTTTKEVTTQTVEAVDGDAAVAQVANATVVVTEVK